MRSSYFNMLIVLVTGAASVGCAADSPAVQPPVAEEPGEPAAAEEVPDLEPMLLDRPEVPVLYPEGVEIPTEPEPDLPAEGAMVIDRLCRLATDDEGWAVLEVQPEAGRAELGELRALPSELLEQMRNLQADNPQAKFRVSGEITVFQDHAYLLPRRATLYKPRSEPDEPEAEEPDEPLDRDSSPDDIIGKLMREQPGRPVMPVEGYVEPETRFVVDRLIRVIPEEDTPWYVARFEADDATRDRPLRILPCRLLQRGINRGEDTVFHMSGEVTRYRGRDYLLPRRLVPKRDVGRF